LEHKKIECQSRTGYTKRSFEKSVNHVPIVNAGVVIDNCEGAPMRTFRFLPVFLFFLLLLTLQPGCLLADNSAASVKVDKGDVVWSQRVGADQQIYFSTFLTGQNTWSAPVKVTDDNFKNGHPTIDTGTDGRRWLVWAAGKNTDSALHYSVETNGTWSQAEVVPSTLKVNVSPSVLIDGSGRTWVVWSGNNGGQDEIYCSHYTGKEWTTPVRVNSENEVPDILPVIALNAENIPQVTWYGYRDGAYVRLRSTLSGDSWSPEERVEDSSQNAMQHTETTTNASIENMPSFIERPEKAFVRVYKSSPVK
jgi:hypothetical protein